MTHDFIGRKEHLLVPGPYSCQILCVGICWPLTMCNERSAHSDAAWKVGDCVNISH